MSQLSKLRKALNVTARPGESLTVKELPIVDPEQGERWKVTVSVYRRGCLPPMTYTLTSEQTVSARQMRHVRGGFPAVAAMLWGKIRQDPRHPDHPDSEQNITRATAARLGMPVEELAAEVLQAHAEERGATALAEKLDVMGEDLPGTGKVFIVPGTSPTPSETP